MFLIILPLPLPQDTTIRRCKISQKKSSLEYLSPPEDTYTTCTELSLLAEDSQLAEFHSWSFHGILRWDCAKYVFPACASTASISPKEFRVEVDSQKWEIKISTASHRMIITSKQDDRHDRLDSPDDWVAWEIASDHVGRQGRLGEVDFGTIA